MADILGIYYGLDEITLLGMRDDLAATLKAARSGNRFESANFAHKGFTKANMTYAELVADFGEVNAALKNINPALYGTRRQRLTVSFDPAYHYDTTNIQNPASSGLV